MVRSRGCRDCRWTVREKERAGKHLQYVWAVARSVQTRAGSRRGANIRTQPLKLFEALKCGVGSLTSRIFQFTFSGIRTDDDCPTNGNRTKGENDLSAVTQRLKRDASGA